MLVVHEMAAPDEVIEEVARFEIVRFSTVTVVETVDVPLAFVAVKVYVIVEVGFTVVDPTAVEVLKEPGVIAMFVIVPVAFQLKVEVPAEATTDEEAVKDEMVGSAPASASIV